MPFESKDGSLHPAPQATVQLDLQLFIVEVEVESELGLVEVYDLDSHKEYFQKKFQKLGHSKIPHKILPSSEDPSKEVLAVSKCFQHQTSLLESSAIPQVLHLQTELGSKAQKKLKMMLDKMEPMKFHEIMHFENLLMLYGHLESQYDISADGYTSEEGIPASKALCNSSFTL